MEAKVQSKAATSTSLAPVAPVAPPAAIASGSNRAAEPKALTAQSTSQPQAASAGQTKDSAAPPAATAPAVRQSAADAARQARGGAKVRNEAHHVEMDEPTTRYNRHSANAAANNKATADDKQRADAPARTQLVRGKARVSRADFHQDPVVGWLVIVGGPGLGAFRPIFEGNNTLGRSSSQRIPVDFGDDTISSEEQAYIRYDSVDRTFLFVPNLAKTNVVQINSQKPTGAVALAAMDVITVGRTQLVFVPFCGTDFDWSELSNLKE